MPAGFGFSIGDFIAVLNLVRAITEALKSAGGAKDSLKEILQQLLALEKVLIRVKDVELDEEQEGDAIALQHAASQCQATIDGFLTRITKYQSHLGKATLSQPDCFERTKLAWMSIKWALCHADDVTKLKADLTVHTISMELLLLAVNMNKATIDAKKQKQRHDSLVSQFRDTANLFLQKFAMIAQQVNALHEMARNVVQLNFRIFHTVMAMHRILARIPLSIEREQPVTLTDPFGHVSPFHLEFIRSRECLLAVLRIHFENAGASLTKLDGGDYLIEDVATKRTINLTEEWQACFHPGQRVAMSVLYKHVRLQATNACPSCQAACVAKDNEEIQCSTCGLTFQRIVEVPEEEQYFPPDHTSPAINREDIDTPSWPSSSEDSLSAPVWTSGTLVDSNLSKPPPRVNVGRKRKIYEDEEAELEGLKRFRRLGYYPPETRGARCGLWALWSTVTGRKTLQGVCTAVVLNIKDKPFLNVRETGPHKWTLLHEQLSEMECEVSRFDDIRILFVGRLKYPKYNELETPLAHALCFQQEQECSTIWYVLPEENKRSPVQGSAALNQFFLSWDLFLANQATPSQTTISNNPPASKFSVFGSEDGHELKAKPRKRVMTKAEFAEYKEYRMRRACDRCRIRKRKCDHRFDPMPKSRPDNKTPTSLQSPPPNTDPDSESAILHRDIGTKDITSGCLEISEPRWKGECNPFEDMDGDASHLLTYSPLVHSHNIEQRMDWPQNSAFGHLLPTAEHEMSTLLQHNIAQYAPNLGSDWDESVFTVAPQIPHKTSDAKKPDGRNN